MSKHLYSAENFATQIKIQREIVEATIHNAKQIQNYIDICFKDARMAAKATKAYDEATEKIERIVKINEEKLSKIEELKQHGVGYAEAQGIDTSCFS